MLPPVTEVRVSGYSHHALQIPQLPDPGNVDDHFVQSERLDFSVRLGSTLARGHDIEDRKVQQELRLATEDVLAADLKGSSSPRSPRDVSCATSMHVSSKPGMCWRDSRRCNFSNHSAATNECIIYKETPLAKVQRVFKTVLIISGVCLALKRYVKACETKTWSFMEMYLHVKEDLSQVVAFNPQSFARVEPERSKLKKLLGIHPHQRTTEHIKVTNLIYVSVNSYKGTWLIVIRKPTFIFEILETTNTLFINWKILALMRDNKSFQDYPSHIQLQLARCMTYQSYEARRVVLKQGHRPEAFYIVLSGYVMANVEDVSPTNGKKFAKTVKEIGPGDTFGELALIEGGRRTATIVCKTSVELLVILKDDFDNIIREPLVKQIDEHVTFCRTMALFQDFPCEKLAENPAQFFYHFFKKGDIVVRDSRDSKYIIVVKAGKCTVVTSYTEKPKSRRRPISIRSQNDIDAAFPHYEDIQKIRSFLRKPKSDAEKLKDTICIGLLTGQIDKSMLAEHGPDVQRPKSSVTPGDLEKKRRPPPFIKSKTLSDFYETVTRTRHDAIVTDEALMADMKEQFWSRRLQYVPKANRNSTAISGLRYSAAGRAATARRAPSTNPFYTREKNVYAQIADLGTGTVFGLESLVQKTTTCTSLVSDGAECIFISKRLFLSLANIKVLKLLTDMIQTYPSQDYIEEQLRNNRNWQKYKAGLVSGILNRRR